MAQGAGVGSVEFVARFLLEGLARSTGVAMTWSSVRAAHTGVGASARFMVPLRPLAVWAAASA